MEDILKDIIRNIYHRDIPPDVNLIERNGYVFFAHPTRRFDPITLGIIAMGVGTGVGIMGTLQQGKDAEKIAKARAAVDLENAKAAREASVEKARIQKEKGRRFIETQKGAAAAGNIRLNVGAPLVIEAQTRADIATDMGFILQQGREESRFYRSRAAWTRAQGKAARRKSKWDAISQGLMGFGSIAMMGSGAGGGSAGTTAGSTAGSGTGIWGGPASPGELGYKYSF